MVKKLSIIIPYYETYEMTMKLLRELSIQYTDEIEIILIDDYCKKEFNNTPAEGINEIILGKIKCINHTKNMGVAKSRNEGIELAKGKYVAFIDSDDMITMDYVETLLNAIDTYDTDVINFNWYDMTEHIEYRKPHNPAPWKQIYKKETIQRFREDLPYGREDVAWQEIIDSGKYSITYLDKMIYMYNSNREGSLYWLSTHEGVKK
jgi:glycosyltransferase involved in cell wall biosynthesis